jgi:hypothetical protein
MRCREACAHQTPKNFGGLPLRDVERRSGREGAEKGEKNVSLNPNAGSATVSFTWETYRGDSRYSAPHINTVIKYINFSPIN